MTLYNELFNSIICPDCLANLSFKSSSIDKRHCRCNKITIDYYSASGCYLYIKNSATLRLQYIVESNYYSYSRFIIVPAMSDNIQYYEPLLNIYKQPFEYLSKEDFIENINEVLKTIYKIERNLLFV